MRTMRCTAALLLATLVACSSKSEDGRGDVAVSASAALAVGLAQVRVTISGTSSSGTPVYIDEGLGLSADLSRYEGRFTSILVGTYDLHARALDASGAVKYEQHLPLTIEARTRKFVSIVLGDSTAADPFHNAAPRIDALIASAQQVDPGARVGLFAFASDPDGDALTYSWSDSCGTTAFEPPGGSYTQWTTPACEAPMFVTVTVSDGKVSSSANIAFAVSTVNARGSADVSVTFSRSPIVRNIAVVSGSAQIAPGAEMALLADAFDPDEDPLTYSWGSSCGGSFVGSGAAVIFQAPATEAPGCVISLTVSDGVFTVFGNYLAIDVRAVVGEYIPQVTSTFQSALDAAAGESVTFRVRAVDPDGRPLSYYWFYTEGTTSTPLGTGSPLADGSELTWTAPACPASGTYLVRVNIMDGGRVGLGFTFRVSCVGTPGVTGMNVLGVGSSGSLPMSGSISFADAAFKFSLNGISNPTDPSVPIDPCKVTIRGTITPAGGTPGILACSVGPLAPGSGAPAPVDLVFALDTTGSMGATIAGVQSSVLSFADSLAAAGVDARYSVFTYGDAYATKRGVGSAFPIGLGVWEPPFMDDWERPFVPFGTVADLRAFIGAVQASTGSNGAYGGGDWEENTFGTVQFAYDNLGYRPGAAKTFIVLTDAPSHERGSALFTGYETWMPPTGAELVAHVAGDAAVHVVGPDGYNLNAVAAGTGGGFIPMPYGGAVDLNALGITSFITSGFSGNCTARSTPGLYTVELRGTYEDGTTTREGTLAFQVELY